jgi:8-oxo-dGTP pyrophosphatase MutT (NUDIX family)
MQPVPRVSARVLPVCPEGEVLLLQDQDPTYPGELRWGTIGGALDPGETHEQAAIRELYEETGLVIGPEVLTPAFHRSTHDYSWGGVAYRSDNTWFATAMSCDVEVSFEHLVPEEVGNVVAWAWWSPEALEADGSAVGADLPGLMGAAVAAVRESAR